MTKTDFAGLLDGVRAMKPRVHCFAGFVTANDCANMLLAVGASPIMADDPDEAEEVASICDALVLSLGTPSARRIEAMMRAGKCASALRRPVVLDPVGVTASLMRQRAAGKMMGQLRLSVIRGNASEIRALAGECCGRCGIDAREEETETQDTQGIQEIHRRNEAAARRLSRETGAVVILSGSTDVVTDGCRVCLIRGGHPMMRSVTGTGCQLSALTGAFAAANPDALFEAVCAAAGMMKLCGERAHAALSAGEGSMALRNRIIDEAYWMTTERLKEGCRYAMG